MSQPSASPPSGTDPFFSLPREKARVPNLSNQTEPKFRKLFNELNLIQWRNRDLGLAKEEEEAAERVLPGETWAVREGALEL